MAFTGYIVLHEGATVDGAPVLPNFPKAIEAESESLGINKTLNIKPQVVRSNRSNYIKDYADLGESPSGNVKYRFRTDDCLTSLYSHFQAGTAQASSGTYTYTVFPSVGPLRARSGDYSVGSFGVTPQKPYVTNITKNLQDDKAYIFIGGVSDKLGFDFTAEEDASLEVGFVFGTYAIGSTVGTVPPQYSQKDPFNFASVSIEINAQSFPLNSFSFVSDNSIQTQKKAGERNPTQHWFGRHTVKGKLTFDLPETAADLVGSMITSSPFTIVGTLFNATHDQIIFNLPKCLRLPFDFTANNDNINNRGEIPFEAVASSGTPAVTITIKTTYAFNPLINIDVIEDTLDSEDTLVDDLTSTDIIEEIV